MVMGKGFRFIGIGLLNTTSYLIITWGLAATTKLDVKVINVIAYLACMTLSYVGHRKVTFRSKNQIRNEAWRFVITNLVNLLASTVLLIAVEKIGFSRYMATAFSALMIMTSSFVMMQIWVFRDESDKQMAGGRSAR